MTEIDITDYSTNDIASKVALANETMESLKASGQRHSDWMRQAFEGADIVIGFWQDQNAPRGVRKALLKGRGRLQLISQGTRSIAQRILYVHSSMEELAAMSQVWGDDRLGAPKSNVHSSS